jgi:hypothetical protein
MTYTTRATNNRTPEFLSSEIERLQKRIEGRKAENEKDDIEMASLYWEREIALDKAAALAKLAGPRDAEVVGSIPAKGVRA